MISAYTSKGSSVIAERKTTSFVIDSASDLEDLPVFPEVMPGSSAIDTDTGDVYILNASGDEWKKI